MPNQYTRRPRTVAERFWPKVNKTDGCWLWTGSLNEYGYGSFRYNERTSKAHRVAYQLAYGPIPVGMGVLHRCDTPACVRPDHLFLGTQADNLSDAKAKGRTPTGDRNWTRRLPHLVRRGESQPASRLTDAQVAEIRKRYAAGGIRQRDLAAEYGIGQMTVSHIVRRRTWRHLP